MTPAGYIVFDMGSDQEPARDLPVLPGFREMARHRQEVLADLVVRRQAVGLTQADVATRMGTSQSAVARLEAGGVDARLSTLERYAAAVGQRLELRLHGPRPGEDPR